MLNSYFGLARPGAADAANRCRSALLSCYHLFSRSGIQGFQLLGPDPFLPRAGASSGEAPATGGYGATGASSTTDARAFAADLLQVQQSEIFNSIHDCG
jgi:hypothetical protein